MVITDIFTQVAMLGGGGALNCGIILRKGLLFMHVCGVGVELFIMPRNTLI